MEDRKQVFITLTDYYRTFDGGDKTTYRFPIRVGVLSYDCDMTWIEGDHPRYKTLEIVAITEDEVSFVVDKDFLDGKESAVHTLKLAGEEKVFERITEESARIYDEEYDYEQIHRLTVKTEG